MLVGSCLEYPWYIPESLLMNWDSKIYLMETSQFNSWLLPYVSYEGWKYDMKKLIEKYYINPITEDIKDDKKRNEENLKYWNTFDKTPGKIFVKFINQNFNKDI